MRALLAVLVLLTLAFAGCASKGGDKDGDDGAGTVTGSGSTSGTSTKTSSGSGSASGTNTSAPAENRAPSGSLAASVVAGSTPLQINFTLNGTDADGDALTWTLSFGDNSTDATGTTLPANVTHNYTAAGTFPVNYTISDGKLNGTYNVTIEVLAGGGAAFTAVFTEGQDYPSNPANSAMIPNVGYAGGTGCAGYWDGTSGVDCVFFELDAAWAGKGFTATADTGNPDLEFWPICDPLEIFAVAGFAVAGPEAGTIPDGALCVVIWNGAASMATPTHTFTVL